MKIAVVIFAMIGAWVALLFNPIHGLALAIIPFIIYMANHCFEVTENQKEMIRLLRKMDK